MTEMILYVLLSFYLLRTVHSVSYFCDLSCGLDHTVCQRHPCLPTVLCGSGYKRLEMYDTLRKVILKLHNDFRLGVAEGVFFQIPPAADMNVLDYDQELEFVAQCWANACRTTSDNCRSTRRFRKVGQNVAVIALEEGDSYEKLFESAFNKRWFPQLASLTYRHIVKFKKQGVINLNAIVQIMCASTTHVGCGATKFGEGDLLQLLIVCNYGPQGCSASKPIYTPGQMGSCGNRSTNKHGLCKTSRSGQNTNWKPPFKMGASSTKMSYLLAFTLVCLVLYSS